MGPRSRGADGFVHVRTGLGCDVHKSVAVTRASARWPRAVVARPRSPAHARGAGQDRKSTRLNSSHVSISYAVFCLKKKKKIHTVGELDTTEPTSELVHR